MAYIKDYKGKDIMALAVTREEARVILYGERKVDIEEYLIQFYSNFKPDYRTQEEINEQMSEKESEKELEQAENWRE